MRHMPVASTPPAHSRDIAGVRCQNRVPHGRTPEEDRRCRRSWVRNVPGEESVNIPAPCPYWFPRRFSRRLI
jgi:hypothetical protein